VFRFGKEFVNKYFNLSTFFKVVICKMCCDSILRCILIIVNLLTMFVGIALIVVGAILQWGQQFLINVIGPALGSLLGGLATQNGNSNPQLSAIIGNLEPILGSYATYLGYSGIVMVILGGILFLLAILGIAGAARKNSCCLIIYIIPVAIIAAIFIIIFIYWLANRAQLQALGATQFTQSISTGYMGFNTTDASSGLINLLNARLSCCGVSGWQDFNNTTKWNHYDSYQNYSNNSAYISPDIKVVIPVSCCAMYNYSMIPLDWQCPLGDTLNLNTSNANTGCYTKVWGIMGQYALYTSFTFVGLAIVTVILVIIAATLIHKFRTSHKSVV